MNNHLGEKIRRLRKEAGLTQTQLAQGIVTPSMICQIEAGKAMPSYHVLEAIAARLGRPLSVFISDVQPLGKHKASLQLARALMRKGEFEHACPLLESLYGEANLQIPRTDVELDLAVCYIQQNRVEEAQTILESLLMRSMYMKNRPLAFLCLLHLGEAARRTERNQVALYHLRKAYTLMQQEKEIPLKEKISLLQRMGRIYQEMGCFEKAQQCLQMAYEWSQSSLTEEEQGHQCLEQGLQAFSHARYEEATAYATKANILYEQIEQKRLLTDMKCGYAHVQAEKGNLSEAIKSLQECLKYYEIHKDKGRAAATEVELAHLYLREGFTAEAEKALQRAEPYVQTDVYPRARWYHAQALLHVHGERHSEALSLYAQTLRLYQQAGVYQACAQVMEEASELYQQRQKNEPLFAS